uniref:BAR/IMD domain containing adaptor protein 2 like 2a n=1 Tax=Sinocyclocheilus grahami TaxID=75366 RepID=A0A672T3I1_SINGR
MSGQNSDQLHRTTLTIYTSIMEQFNPSLQRLVALGNSYIQAFQALAVTSEAYFSALSKMGEQAMQSMSSRLLGKLTFPLIISFPFTLLNYSRTRFCQTQRFTKHSSFSFFSDEYVLSIAGTERESKRMCMLKLMFPCHSLSLMLTVGQSNHWARFPLEVWRPYFEIRKKHYALFFVFNMTNFHPFTSGPSPQPSRSTSISGLAGGRVMRALVPHPPSANSTLLPFSREETITLLIKEPRNGWLFGCSDSSGRQGWFPAAYVANTAHFPTPASSSFRRSSSMSNLLDQPVSRSQQTAPTLPPPPPPAPSTRSSNSRPVTPTPSENRVRPVQINISSTNPFATVKLKPTKTNDRSAPRI